MRHKKCNPKIGGCGKIFTPDRSFQTGCSIPCAINIAKDKQEKKKRKDLARRKQDLKTRSDWLREAQKECNAYIRERDKAEGCISCDKPATWAGQWHASHYRPTGNCSPLRFHPFNISKACSECNNHKSGNLIPYRARLVELHGEQIVTWMESQNHPYSWDIEDLKDIKAYYKQKLKQLRERQ